MASGRLELVRLDERARAYIQEQLDLETVFCKKLAEVVDLSKGDCFTLLPEKVETDRACDFGSGFRPVNRPPRGGLVPVVSLIDRQSIEVENFLKSSSRAITIIDDVAAEKSDPAIAGCKNCIFYGTEVCRVLMAPASRQGIREALASGNQIWHGLVALCCPEAELHPASLANPAILETCLASVREIHATAYDGEGFIIWRRW